ALLGQLGQQVGRLEEEADGGVHEQVDGGRDQLVEGLALVVVVGHRFIISDAVDTEHEVLVGQLAPVLDQEAGLAHELVGLLGLDAAAAVAPVVGLGALVLVLLLVLGLGGDAVLEDGVEVGLDVVGVGLLLVLLVLLRVPALAGLGRRGLGGWDGLDTHLLLV